MPPSRNDNVPEEDKSRSASNESEHSNQPHQVPATPSNPHLVSFVEPEQNATSHKTLFGLKREVKKQYGPTHFNRFDYEQKYPRDPFGQERAENARVWLTYLDEAESYDRDKVDGWKDTVDVLLVFAGLFSAVVSTFLSQTSQSLQQNFAQVSASLLYEMVQLKRAQLTGASIDNVAKSTLTPNTPFKPSTNASLVNGLWLSSLTTSLCAALSAVLAKQWLYYYLSPVPGTARDKMRVRQFRFEGLEKWKVAPIIDLLPVLLHLALGLFLIGLVAFILPMDIQIVWVIIVLSGFTYTLYFVSIILPIWYPQCPYATPLTIYVGFIVQSLLFIYSRLPSLDHTYFTRLSLYRNKIFSGSPLRRFHHPLHLAGSTISKETTRAWNILKAKITTSSILPLSKNWRETQLRESIGGAATMLEDNALYWLSSTSSNPSVSRIISRSVFKSQKFDILWRFYPHLSNAAHNPRFDEEWDENSLRLLLDDSEFFEDLYHSLHLMVLSGKLFFGMPKVVSIIRKGSASFQKDVKESYPELFNIIAVFGKDRVEVLLTGLGDKSLKLREDIWLCLLQKAREDIKLASQIISSGSFNLFSWHNPPSSQIHRNEPIPLANELPDFGLRYLPRSDLSRSELNRSAFSYLFRYFFQKRFPDDGSFESCYLLFVAIYRNLVSDHPLIVNPMLRERALKYLLAAFSHVPFREDRCIQNQVIDAKLVNRMQHDLLLHNSFFDNSNMSLDIQKDTVHCFERFWQYQMGTTSDFMPFFTARKEELQFIYRWCSKAEPCGALLVQQLFTPGNLSNLCTLLLEDGDHAKSNFGNCLKLLLWSSHSFISRKHMTLYEDHVIPNVTDLFTATVLSDDDPLFSILYDPSVLAQAWDLILTYPSVWKSYSHLGSIMDRSRPALAMLPSRLDSGSLKKIYDLMVVHIKNLHLDSSSDSFDIARDPDATRRACIFVYIFGRMAGLIVDPSTFDLPSSIIDAAAFKDITDMRNELECQFMEERRKQSHSSLLKISRITQIFQTSRRKESNTEETELEAV